jgi:hypothetical protein
MGRHAGWGSPLPWVESEEARFGDANGAHNAQRLEKQNRYLGGWSAWTNLQCDESQNSIKDWWAVRYSDQHWRMEPYPPGIC